MIPSTKTHVLLATALTLSPALHAGPTYDFTAGVTKLLLATTITTAGWLNRPSLDSIQQDLSSENNQLNGFLKALYYPGFLLLSNIISDSSKKSFSKACSRSSFYRRWYNVGTGMLSLALLAHYCAPKRENKPGINPFAESTAPRKLEAGVNAIARHLTLMYTVELASSAADSFSQALSTRPEVVDLD